MDRDGAAPSCLVLLLDKGIRAVACLYSCSSLAPPLRRQEPLAPSVGGGPNGCSIVQREPWYGRSILTHITLAHHRSEIPPPPPCKAGHRRWEEGLWGGGSFEGGGGGWERGSCDRPMVRAKLLMKLSGRTS